MSDCECLRCFACGELIEDEEELTTGTAGWDDEFEVPCHRDCVSHE